jgi:DNA-directed RNA polymerase subunit RPC12/RpoP
MPASRVPTRKDWIVNIVIVAVAVGALFVAGLKLGSTHPVVFIGAALVVLFLLVRWNAGTTAYLCADCGQEFTLTPLQDFLSPHTPGSKYARCPHCGKRNWNQARVRE